MAEVIHIRKGKYLYKYEHTRQGDKVVSKYMYPVNGAGERKKPYQAEVAQHPEPERGKVAQPTNEMIQERIKIESEKVKTKKYKTKKVSMAKTKTFNGKKYTLYKEYKGTTAAKMRRHFIASEYPTWLQEVYRDKALRVGLYIYKPPIQTET